MRVSVHINDVIFKVGSLMVEQTSESPIVLIKLVLRPALRVSYERTKNFEFLIHFQVALMALDYTFIHVLYRGSTFLK